MNKTKNKLSTLLVLVLVVVLAASCSTKSEKKKDDINMKSSNTNSIQQEKEDLLAGVSKAVCYSGFRTGQHPDRGEGAKNPGYATTRRRATTGRRATTTTAAQDCNALNTEELWHTHHIG